MKYNRILIKLSGEALAGDKGFGIDEKTVSDISSSIKKVHNLGTEIGIVVGGGNFWRGRSSGDMDRTTADHIGMLGTVMNALALGDVLKSKDIDVRVQTAVHMNAIAEPYIRNRAVRHMEKNRIVIFGCGTGSPFFSTDTGAALRAAETNADIIFKATNVNGVYDKDPAKFDDAKMYETLKLQKVLEKNLGVMDSTAASICRENNIPILVFNINNPDNLYKAANGENIGTLVEA